MTVGGFNSENAKRIIASTKKVEGMTPAVRSQGNKGGLGRTGFWAITIDNNGTSYNFKAVALGNPSADGGFVETEKEEWRSGAAIEVNGNINVPAGSVIWVQPASGGEYAFSHCCTDDSPTLPPALPTPPPTPEDQCGCSNLAGVAYVAMTSTDPKYACFDGTVVACEWYEEGRIARLQLCKWVFLQCSKCYIC